MKRVRVCEHILPLFVVGKENLGNDLFMPKRYFGRNCWWIGGGFKIVLERAKKKG